jgi:hypothetical protein
MENFGSMETMEQIKQKLSLMDYGDLMELLAIYQCPVGELAVNIAKAKGLKDSQLAAGKKKEVENFHLYQLIYSERARLDEVIRSDKVIEGVLKDICAGVEGIAMALEKR